MAIKRTFGFAAQLIEAKNRNGNLKGKVEELAKRIESDACEVQCRKQAQQIRQLKKDIDELREGKGFGCLGCSGTRVDRDKAIVDRDKAMQKCKEAEEELAMVWAEATSNGLVSKSELQKAQDELKAQVTTRS